MSASPVLAVEGLTVRFGKANAPVVDNIGFEIGAGECVALVGESGSGKSVTARSLIGLAGQGASVDAAQLSVNGRSLSGLSDRAWRGIRGRQIGFVLQDALVSLDPLRTIGREIDDTLRLHTPLPPAARRQRVVQLLRDVGMPDPQLRIGQRAGELSGGMRQRALIASAIALEPALLIADEPTTALDRTIQARILELLSTLRERGTAVLLISHDLSVVARIADRIAVMRHGAIVEAGPTQEVLGAPQHEYTKALLRAIPTNHPRGTRLSTATRPRPALRPHAETAVPVLELDSVSKRFRSAGRTTLDAVVGVSLTVTAGQTLGLVGESGSGKTTTARIALGLTAPDAGTVRLLGSTWSPMAERLRRDRRSLIGAIYQDPLSSFDPRLTVGRILADALSGGRSSRIGGQGERIAELLCSVGLSPDLIHRRTHALSGGQRQRVAVARAIAPGPRVIVCDEPVSSLDVSVQAQVLDLLDDLQEQLGLAYLFISHDLGVVRHVSDTVAVMSGGRIVEYGATGEVFGAPKHPYTRELFRS